MKAIASLFSILCVLLSLEVSAAGVTYASCPTLKPLPITKFMPAAMKPIKDAQTAFDVGMNKTIKEAVKTAALIQSESINMTFVAIMDNMIKVSQNQKQQELEVDRQYSELMLAYRSELEDQKSQLNEMLFPGDESMMQPKEGEERTIDPSSPSYKFVKQMCSAGKMQEMLTSKKVRDKALADKNRRSQKILHNIQAVSSIATASKKAVDLHYELFCSEQDNKNNLCDSESLSPNADLEAYNYLYPTGYPDQTTKYTTLYTYSPVESLAAYQYINNLTGTLYLTPPTTNDMSDISSSTYVAAYKQMVAALSMSTDVLLSISKVREPVNSSGFLMSELDVLNHLIEKSKMPENSRVIKSSSDSAKLLEIQKQMALSQKIKFLILQQKDKQRILEASDLAVDSTLNTILEN